ncbi:MAG: DUF4908 domain-containing protein [Caulobacterales bacterium]|nr:DUF4908 domain-containing protein [Caulobacterales bacterium]
MVHTRHGVIMTAVIALAATPAAPAQDLRVGHYLTADGLDGLVIDRSAAPALARLDGEEEVLALTETPASRDSVFLARDDGVYVLRLANDGGLTLFRPPRAPAALERAGDAEPLFDANLEAAASRPASGRAQSATPGGGDGGAGGCSAEIRWPMAGEGGDDAAPVRLSDEANAVSFAPSVAEACANAARAITRLAGEPLGAEALTAGLDEVHVTIGDDVGAALEHGALVLTVRARGGPAARPSSHLVRDVLLNHL